jgi:hypothetical protein
VALALADWSPSGQPGSVFDMTVPDAWESLAADYTHSNGDAPLDRIFEIAQALGVINIVKEPRYIDADWRSQLSRFYNGTFRRYPSVCHRLHFFTRPVPPDLKDLSGLQDAYRGYTILRPLPLSPVGRTMIAPPAELADAVRCEDTDTVDVFGWSFQIRAMPFISQDTQFLRCAHAALWMVLAHARRSHGMPRRLPGDIHDAAFGGVMVGRQLPSDGLSGYQLFSAMERLGLSPTRKDLPQSQAEELVAGNLRLYGIVCRYINSSLPPVVISESHAWVMVAYRRTASAGNSVIQLWRHDDARGPYLPVDDPWNEPERAHQPWLAVYLPLLPKAYLDAERAEVVGRAWVGYFENSALYAGTTLEAANQRPNTLDQATLRTFLLTSTEFKQNVAARGVPDELAAAYRLAPMSRYVWVIEVVDRQRRAAGQPDVLGEVVLDATLTQFEPLNDPASVLAMHIDNFTYLSGVDESAASQPSVAPGQAYRSACPAL